jgi:hypothetical protein
MKSGNHPFKLSDRLPTEHGFWVMLGAAQASALLRTSGSLFSVVVAVSVVVIIIAAASIGHRQVRKSSAAQLTAAAALALSSGPVELAGHIPLASVATAAMARVVVFVTSALVVRAAFARAARAGQRRSRLLCGASLALPALSATFFFSLGRTAEAGTCVIAGAVCSVFAWSAPTVKQLKPLGLALAGLALVTVVTLAL